MSVNEQPTAISLDKARELRRAGKGRRSAPMTQEPAPGSGRPVLAEPPPSLRENPGPGEPAPPPVDLWSPEMLTEHPGYDTEAFYTATSIAEEGTTQTNLTISRTVMYQLETIVQSRRFPEVNVVQDALRDAVVHWLHKRSHALPPHIQAQIDAAIHRHTYLSQMEARARARAEIDKIIETTERELDAARVAKDRDAYKDVLRAAKAQRGTMGGPGGERMEAIIDAADDVLSRWETEA